MTRDEHRAKCIEAMACAAHAKDVSSEIEPLAWEEEIEDVREFWIDVEAAAFDSLHGIARVDPIEATEEMLQASLWRQPKHWSHVMQEWRAVSTAGDLTNAPEEKP